MDKLVEEFRKRVQIGGQWDEITWKIEPARELLARIERLEAEKAELFGALKDVTSDLFLAVESKHGAKVASGYPSIVRAEKVIKAVKEPHGPAS